VRAAKEILRQNISYDVIITTGMKRTDETARIIAEEIGFVGKTITISDLRERIVSEKYEGKLWSEIAQEFKEKFGAEPNFV
jgi:broad specificity phosphatase PhoE